MNVLFLYVVKNCRYCVIVILTQLLQYMKELKNEGAYVTADRTSRLSHLSTFPSNLTVVIDEYFLSSFFSFRFTLKILQIFISLVNNMVLYQFPNDLSWDRLSVCSGWAQRGTESLSQATNDQYAPQIY